MKLRLFLFHFLLIVQVDLHRYNDQNDNDSIYELDNLLNNYNHHKKHSNKEYIQDLTNNDQNDISSFQREKKYSSRKKITDDIDTGDEQEKSIHHNHISKTNNNRSELSNKSNRITQTTTESYIEEASLCINEFDIKTEQLVKVKELKNGAHMIRFVRIDEPSSSHGLDIKDICMLNCCVEEKCDLAMLSEQRTNDGYKCYLFACNGSCTYASHQEYTSMILKKDLSSYNDDLQVTNKQSKTNEKGSGASSSTISTACRSIEFSCRDGSCIPYYDVCNSYEDCPSGIDEAMCSSEFTLHQRTQQENRKKPSNDIDNDIDENFDDVVDEDQLITTTMKSKTKLTSTKSSLSKSKSKNREGGKQDKNLTSLSSPSSFFYNIDLDTQERVSRLQKLKEYLEETKGPEAWYHLFQTLIQHQQQEHTNLDSEQTGTLSSSDDDNNFQDHLLALEQQWIADRQKTSTTTTTTTTTIKSKIINRKPTTTTTKRMKIINDDDLSLRRPSTIIDDESTDEDVDDGDRYYWRPTYDDRHENRYNYQQKSKTTSTTKKPKTKYPFINRDSSTMTTLLRANNIDSDNYSHTRSFLRESSVILLFLLGLICTIILLVLVGFYCRDSWKHGRMLKNRSTDADYLINGLYL